MSDTVGTEARPAGSPIRWLTARRPLALVAAIVLPALVLALAAWLRRWTTDDAFINYRIVDQLRSGHGPVFNRGERVEAYTSPLWLALLAVGDLVLPLRIEYVAAALSIPLSALGVVAMGIGSRRLLAPAGHTTRTRRTWWVPAGSIVLVALPPVWDFATAGLETGLTLAWVGALTLALARSAADPGRPPSWVLVVVGLGPLVRPDCAVPAVLVLAFVLGSAWRASGPVRALRGLAVAAAAPLSYQVFRMAYFASIVPNTALAKQAGFAHWREGWSYLGDFVGPYALYLPVAVLAVGAAAVVARLPRRHQVAVLVLPVAAVLHAAFLIRAGGDYIHARLLLPPLFSLLAPFALLPLPVAATESRREPARGSPPARLSRRRVPSSAVAALAVLLLAGWGVVTAAALRKEAATLSGRTLVADGRLAAVGPLADPHPVTAESMGWGRDSAAARRLRAAPVSFGGHPFDVDPDPALPLPAVALYGIGVSGYSAGPDVYVLDLLGLADPITARLRVERPGFIGHEKPLPAPWIAGRLTGEAVDQTVFGTRTFVTPLYVSPPKRFAADTRAARQVLDCGPLRRLRAATHAPLTPSRALANLWRAPGLTALRIDPDPMAARAQLC
ncbi:MAG: hypothetical protein ACR2LA_03835 [Acidimicrobiales bacterium]